MKLHPRSASAWATACALMIVSCTPSSAPTPVAVVTQQPAGQAAPRSVTASVRVEPAALSELAFVISAPVGQILVAEGDRVRTGQTLMVLDTPDLEYEVDAAEYAVTASEADESIQSQGRRKWDGFKFVWLSGPPEQRQVAHAKVLQAQAGLEAAQAELGQASLRAPLNGTVVSINISQGEVVQPGQVVLVMADLSQLQVETTDLSERDIASVHIGQPARVSLKPFSSDLVGHVTAISPKAGLSADGDTVFKVTMQLFEPPSGLLWGMTGEAEIVIQD